MNAWASLVADRPLRVLAGVAALTLLALAGLFDLKTRTLRLWVDPAIERLLPGHDPERQFADRVRLQFAGDAPIFIALGANAEEPVFSVGHLNRVKRIGDRIAELPGVHEVQSLATEPNLRDQDGTLEIQTFLEALEAGHSPADLDADAKTNPLVWGTLVAADGSKSALVLTLKDVSDRDFLLGDYEAKIRAILDEERGDAPAWITGIPVLKAQTSRALVHDLRVALPAIAAVGGAVLLLAFASVRGVLLPLATIGLSLLWLLGTLAATGRPLNLVTALVPPLLLTVGLAYAMHLLADYAEACEAPDRDESARLRATLEEAALPIVIAGLTTAAGLGSLMFSSLAAIREFGALASIGVIYTVFLSLTFLPAALRVWGRFRAGRPAPAAHRFARLGTQLGRFDMQHRRAVVGAGLVFLLVSLGFASQLEVGNVYIENFPETSQVRRDYETVRDSFAGANPLQIVISMEEANDILDPEFLEEVAELQMWLEAQPEVGSTASIADYLHLLNHRLTGRDAPPEDATTARQLLLFSGGERVRRFADSLYQSARLELRATVDDSRSVSALLRRVEDRLAALPRALDAHVTGRSVLVNSTLEKIARGQVQSIAAAFLIIYAILVALFWSFGVGLLALVPNALPVAFYFGMLGALGIPLDSTTSLVASIALGIAVDDTVHYLVRFGAAARRAGDETQGALDTLRALIRPVTLTSLTLCCGFLVLTTSELYNQVLFGALAAATLAVAWGVDVTVTPALTAGAKVVTFWDILRLDIGRDPQRVIPLFEGLSDRQTRVFVLMMDIRELRADEVLMAEGDTGVNDVYAVLEGQLDVFVDRGGTPLKTRVVKQGELVGTLGYYAKRRTETVRAASEARLLRIEERDLAELLRRYPRIAARIFQNLGRAQTKEALAAADRLREAI